MSITRKANSNTTTRKTSRRTTKSSAAFTLAVAAALFATACGAGANATDEAAADPVQTLTSEAPIVETADENSSSLGSQADSDESDADEAEETNSDDADSNDSADDAPAPANVGECSAAQFPSLPFASVVNIDADDAHGGLNVRETPGVSGTKVGTLAPGTVVETSFHADVRCATVDGAVWWHVYGPDFFGWAHTGFLSEQADEFAPITNETEEDASFDCQPLANGECVILIYVPGGEVVFEGTPDEDTIAWAQLDCVYGGVEQLCTALASIDRQDPGNGFAQAPTSALETDCAAGDPATDPVVAMSCAELATRS